MGDDKISFEDFKKLDLKVGEIAGVEDHPNADKLYVLKVDFNEEKIRTIVSGLKLYYTKEELIGKKAIFIANLKSIDLRGINSDGMILAVDDGKEHISLLVPDSDVEKGSKVS